MFIKLYQKSLQLAAHKSSKIFLAIISFIESSFFPVPPDIMIVPMVIAKKYDYIKINMSKLKPIMPLVIVNTLNGKGVKPARNKVASQI